MSDSLMAVGLPCQLCGHAVCGCWTGADALPERTRLLELPHGYMAVIDEADWPIVSGLTLYRGNTGYVYFSKWINGKSQPRTLHSLLLPTPKGMYADHINGNRLDNRRSNLRVVTPQQNVLNRQGLNRNNTSGVRGVGYRPGLSKSRPWLAQIMVNRKALYLGTYSTVEEATTARKSAELEHFGELCP